MSARVDRLVDADLEPEAWLTALAGLPSMGPARLLALSLLYEPVEAWQAVTTGSLLTRPDLAARMRPDPRRLARRWQAAARHIDVAARWRDHEAVLVSGRAHARYPGPLRADLEPPAVVFMSGRPEAVPGPRVAVVGTRRCTRYGFDVASEMGHDLARAGVRVVSGLALGIDGAAHRGALDAAAEGGAPPIAVVASGLDVVYPKRHRSLWERVGDHGLLLSECPLGTSPEAWRFPARNRIIAALADAVVVVESAGQGGSMYTVNEALRRDIPVLAVPGPVRSPASAGTNQLLQDGAHMARDVSDVFTVIGLTPQDRAASVDVRPSPDADGARVLQAFEWQPATLDLLATRTGLDLGPLSIAVAALEAAGWIAPQGLWFERVAAAR